MGLGWTQSSSRQPKVYCVEAPQLTTENGNSCLSGGCIPPVLEGLPHERNDIRTITEAV